MLFLPWESAHNLAHKRAKAWVLQGPRSLPVTGRLCGGALQAFRVRALLLPWAARLGGLGGHQDPLQRWLSCSAPSSRVTPFLSLASRLQTAPGPVPLPVTLKLQILARPRGGPSESRQNSECLLAGVTLPALPSSFVSVLLFNFLDNPVRRASGWVDQDRAVVIFALQKLSRRGTK